MEINHPLVKGYITEIEPHIYSAVITNDYDRAMLFCRYQEFYESPFPEIREKFFTLEQYMKIYTERNKKHHFSYPYDWAGYNIPSDTLMKANSVFINNMSEYDKIMSDIIEYCNKLSEYDNDGIKHPWYLIGTDKLKSKTMEHEISHGLYYVNINYRVEMEYLISNIEPKIYTLLKKELIKTGYVDDKKIIDDEIQAFMSTGKLTSWHNDHYKKYHSDFKKVFKKHYKLNIV